MVVQKPIRVLKYEDIRTNNAQAENRLNKELKEIEKKRKSSWHALSKETIEMKMGVRVQRYRVLKNDLQRKAEENRKADAEKQIATRKKRSTLWQTATVAITKFMHAVPRERRVVNFTKPPKDSDREDKHGQQNRAYKDIYLMRLMQKLNTQPPKVQISYDENGKVKCTRQLMCERIRELVSDLDIDQHNDGTLALAMRRYHRKRRDAVRQVASGRRTRTSDAIMRKENQPSFQHGQSSHSPPRSMTSFAQSPFNTQESAKFNRGRPATTPAGGKTTLGREASLMERLSLPKLSDTIHALQPDVASTSQVPSRVFIPRSQREDYQRLMKQENESLMRIHKAEQKEEYIEVLERVHTFLGERRKCRDALGVQKQALDEREMLIYELLNREQSNVKVGIKLRNILANKVN